MIRSERDERTFLDLIDNRTGFQDQEAVPGSGLYFRAIYSFFGVEYLHPADISIVLEKEYGYPTAKQKEYLVLIGVEVAVRPYVRIRFQCIKHPVDGVVQAFMEIMVHTQAGRLFRPLGRFVQ